MKLILGMIGICVSVFAIAGGVRAEEPGVIELLHRDESGKKGCPVIVGDGGHLPSPFDVTLNRKVELSTGEYYTLVGQVLVSGSTRAYLLIDLERHPWLATQNRLERPYYILEGSTAFWKKYEQRWIQLTARANGLVVRDGVGSYRYELSLQPVVPAQLLD